MSSYHNFHVLYIIRLSVRKQLCHLLFFLYVNVLKHYFRVIITNWLVWLELFRNYAFISRYSTSFVMTVRDFEPSKDEQNKIIMFCTNFSHNKEVLPELWLSLVDGKSSYHERINWSLFWRGFVPGLSGKFGGNALRKPLLLRFTDKESTVTIFFCNR